MSKLLLFVVVVSALGYNLVTAKENICSAPPGTRLIGTNGTLTVDKSIQKCSFKTNDTTSSFMMRVEGLKLGKGDLMQFQEPNGPSVDFTPPLNSGFFLVGYKSPEFNFQFNKIEPSVQLTAEFYINQPLQLDCDINNDMQITTIGVSSTKVVFKKTVSELVHLEIIGGKIKDGCSHYLLSESNAVLEIEFTNQVTRIKTSPVLESCSKTYTDKVANTYDISGPVPKGIPNKYKCVNIFTTDMNSAHYEADFKDFIGLSDPQDSLLLSDGTTDDDITIFKSSASSYIKQVKMFQGSSLVVIYEGNQLSSTSEIQFKLTVALAASGGIVQNPGPLAFPDNNPSQVRYVMRPEPQQYASVSILDSTKLDGVTLKVSFGQKLVATFSSGLTLPPVIASDVSGGPLQLEFSGQGYNKLSKRILYQPLGKAHCHRITSDSFGGLSLSGFQDTCHWAILPSNPVALRSDLNDLPATSCLTIRSLSQNREIFERCNISSSEVLPPFSLDQAIISVKLDTTTSKFNASFSPASTEPQSSVESQENFEVKSIGYPVSYPFYLSGSKSFTKDGHNKTYLVVVRDVDIRAGEKLLINDLEVSNSNRKILGDIVAFNKTLNVTLDSRAITKDFSLKRGYNVQVVQYDKVVEADTKANLLTIASKNLTRCIAKISHPDDSKKAAFGRRVTFNMTHANDYNITVHDGRSLDDASIEVSKTSKIYSGNSTSDTVIISFVSIKPNNLPPELKVDYNWTECGKSDHTCDNFTRCVPVQMLCQGVSYCDDKSDIKIPCSAGPTPAPRIIETGVAGITVFILCIMMLTLGVVVATYGPDMFRALESRFRSGQYTTFSSTE